VNQATHFQRAIRPDIYLIELLKKLHDRRDIQIPFQLDVVSAWICAHHVNLRNIVIAFGWCSSGGGTSTSNRHAAEKIILVATT
jgi:hypothetical protein